MAEDTIMEEREELMVSSKGGDPTLRIAHFLKPSVSSIDGPVFDLPSPPSISPVPTNSVSNKRPLKLAFYGWRCSTNSWKTWVSSMHSSYQSVWEKAGIHEAIMNSTYTFTRNENLIIGFAERWCCETNTFVFPWGETSITLEDIMILGGYSVVGDSVSDPLESREMEETKEKLFRARSEVIRCKAKNATQNGWLAKFMAGGSDIEHEAFLAYWLSRFVFSLSKGTITKYVIPIAVLLARGTKIGLAPPVLASLYKDLRLLKEAINVASHTSKHEANVAIAVTVWSPLQFLQIWALERFPTLQPKPNSINGHGEPRLARWDKAKKVNIENIRLTLDSAGESFLWRPYAANNNCLDDEKLESLSLCLRVDSELVGLGCIEQYLPHRVARQLGFDQDLPAAPGARSNATPQIGWSNYKRPIRDKKLYIPPPHCEPGVTTRYLEWWRNKSKFGQHHQQEGTSIKHVVEKKMITNSNCLETTPQTCNPPGFPPKCISIESSDASDDDRLPISEMLRNMKRRDGPPSMGCQLKSSSSSTANSGTNQMTESVVKPAEREAVMEGSATVGDDSSESRTRTPVNNMVSIYSNLAATEILEARVSKLEKVAAWLKASRKIRPQDS